MSNNNPPFYPGQEVVRIRKTPTCFNREIAPQKGRTYTIRSLSFLRGEWWVYLNEIVNTPRHYFEGYMEVMWRASSFRPIQRHPNAEVAEELKNIEVVEERIDAPETVTA